MIETPWEIVQYGFWLMFGVGLGLLAWAIATLVALIIWGSWIGHRKMRRAADRVFEDVKKTWDGETDD